MKNKNSKVLLVIFCVYAFIIVLCSFSSVIFDYINMALTYLLSYIFTNVTSLSQILEYILLGLIYIGLGIISCLYFIEIYEDNKSIIMYSLAIPLLIVVLSMFIMSFYEKISLLKYLLRFLYIIIGFTIVYVTTLCKIKKVNKGEDNK